jgi:transcriptional regulator with GAF, ATPase, and Fis domain
VSGLDARAFALIAQELMSDPQGEEVTFDTVVKRALEVVPGCDHAGITLRARRGRLESAAASDPLVETCDELQHELGEGPCVEAVQQDARYHSPDLSCVARWPRWGPHVAGLGIGSVIAIQLTDGMEMLGALNMYSTRTHVFGADALDLATTYAIHATNAMQSARLISGLTSALTTRHEIGMAQGILMATYDLDADRAFELLRRVSNNSNVPIRELSHLVAERRRLPREDEVARPT